MILGICGGRDYQLTDDDFLWLDKICKEWGVDEIVHGGATGADACAAAFAMTREIEETVFEADWDMYGRAAGPKRNEEIAKYLEVCGELVAFPGGRGTQDMIRRASDHGIPVHRRG